MATGTRSEGEEVMRNRSVKRARGQGHGPGRRRWIPTNLKAGLREGEKNYYPEAVVYVQVGVDLGNYGERTVCNCGTAENDQGQGTPWLAHSAACVWWRGL